MQLEDSTLCFSSFLQWFNTLTGQINCSLTINDAGSACCAANALLAPNQVFAHLLGDHGYGLACLSLLLSMETKIFFRREKHINRLTSQGKHLIDQPSWHQRNLACMCFTYFRRLMVRSVCFCCCSKLQLTYHVHDGREAHDILDKISQDEYGGNFWRGPMLFQTLE